MSALISLAFLAGASVESVPAQGLGFFDAPYYPIRHARSRRRAPLGPASSPGVESEVPMPVPRPRFSSDPSETKPVGPPLPPPATAPALLQPPAVNPPESAGKAPPAAKAAASAIAPSGARLGEAPGQPLADAACAGRLKARKVDLDTIALGPQPDPRCTIVDAVRLGALVLPDGRRVAFPDRPTLACTTADAFSLYVRDLLAPLAKGTYGATVAAVWTGPGFECRSRDHIIGAKLSAHGQGLAVDIARLRLEDGRTIEVGNPKTDADQGFETAARAAGCGYFHTTLGPGSDSYHRYHWHFDLEVRGAKGDSKYCK